MSIIGVDFRTGLLQLVSGLSLMRSFLTPNCDGFSLSLTPSAVAGVTCLTFTCPRNWKSAAFQVHSKGKESSPHFTLLN